MNFVGKKQFQFLSLMDYCGILLIESFDKISCARYFIDRVALAIVRSPQQQVQQLLYFGHCQFPIFPKFCNKKYFRQFQDFFYIRF